MLASPGNFLSALRALQGRGDQISEANCISLGMLRFLAYPGSTGLTSTGSIGVTSYA